MDWFIIVLLTLGKGNIYLGIISLIGTLVIIGLIAFFIRWTNEYDKSVREYYKKLKREEEIGQVG